MAYEHSETANFTATRRRGPASARSSDPSSGLFRQNDRQPQLAVALLSDT